MNLVLPPKPRTGKVSGEELVACVTRAINAGKVSADGTVSTDEAFELLLQQNNDAIVVQNPVAHFYNGGKSIFSQN